MGTLGLYAALSEDEADRLRMAPDRIERASMLDRIEAEFDVDRLFPVDEAWDLIHRCLGDGTLRTDCTEYPLRLAVLGGSPLDAGARTVACLIPHERLGSLVSGLHTVTPEQWQRSFELLRAAKAKWTGSRAIIGSFVRPQEAPYEGPADEDDFVYSWSYLKGLRIFLDRAFGKNRSVVFWCHP